jgi:UDP-glucuronate 4-epimerase
MPTVLITGTAGFVGLFAAQRFLQDGYKVVGLDCMSDYYDVALKERRLAKLQEHAEFTFVFGKVEEPNLLLSIFKEHRPDIVIHLAAQAGVRFSIENPRAYMESNLIGTFELLEAARRYKPSHILLASTSSVYGANKELPYRETTKADHQVSFYAATKKSSENMAHSYSHLFNIPITMFRFFTVYGPWGRPDMAPYKFTKAILEGKPIDVYNYGKMMRDFTYIDDLIEAVRRLVDVVPTTKERSTALKNDSLSSVAKWRVVNIGNAAPVKLKDFIEAIENATGRKAKWNMMPMQAGDVEATWADVSLMKDLIGYQPDTNIKDGMAEFVQWYIEYTNHKKP